MTNPGDRRETEWIKTPSGNVKVTVGRGYDCRIRCEHVPPRPNEGGSNHGVHCDEWIFELRDGDHAATLQLYSWIRDGKLERQWQPMARPALLPRIEAKSDPFFDYDEYRTLPIYAARVLVHSKCPDEADRGEDCPLFGRCEMAFAGYMNSARFFDRSHAELLEPLALRPVDEIDLAAVVDRMAPLWAKLAGYLAARVDE